MTGDHRDLRAGQPLRALDEWPGRGIAAGDVFLLLEVSVKPTMLDDCIRCEIVTAKQQTFIAISCDLCEVEIVDAALEATAP